MLFLLLYHKQCVLYGAVISNCALSSLRHVVPCLIVLLYDFKYNCSLEFLIIPIKIATTETRCTEIMSMPTFLEVVDLVYSSG